MAFTNPNLITSGVSKEEFEDLKKLVNDIAIDVSKLKQGNIKINDNRYTLINKKIKNAKLIGIPRIESFNFNKKEEPINLDNDVLVESNMNVLDDASDSVVDTIVDLSEVINDNKSYKINKEDLPNIVKTNSSHRTITMDEGKAINIKNSYYNSLVKAA